MNETLTKYSIVIFIIIISILISSDNALREKSDFVTPKEDVRSTIEPIFFLNELSKNQLVTRNISDQPFVQFTKERIETKDSTVKIEFNVSRGENDSIPITNITFSGIDTNLQLNETQNYIKVNHSTSGVYKYVLYAENALNKSINDTIQVFYDTEPPILNVSVFEKYSHHGILIEGYENNIFDVGIDIVEIRFETGISIIINNFKPYTREYKNDKLIHIGYEYYPNLPLGNNSINVIIYDKLGNHVGQNIIMYIPGFIVDIEENNNSSNIIVFPLIGSFLVTMIFILKRRSKIWGY